MSFFLHHPQQQKNLPGISAATYEKVSHHFRRQGKSDPLNNLLHASEDIHNHSILGNTSILTIQPIVLLSCAIPTAPLPIAAFDRDR
jgi:hypothetical protein